MIGVKPVVIQRAVANRVGVLILGKGFRAPSDRACVLGNSPRCAAIAQVVKGAIICPARMLNRRMKADVGDVYSGCEGHAERLDSAIEVLVIERIFIVPDASAGVRHFEAREPNTIISRVRLLPVYRRAGPGHDRWLLAHGGANGGKGEVCRAATHVIPLVRSIVVHVTLARMTLAPGVFVWDDVFRFGKIEGALVLGRDQVTRVHQHSVRGCVMTVAGMIVGCRTYKAPGERIDPGARTDAGLAAV